MTDYTQSARKLLFDIGHQSASPENWIVNFEATVAEFARALAKARREGKGAGDAESHIAGYRGGYAQALEDAAALAEQAYRTEFDRPVEERDYGLRLHELQRAIRNLEPKP